jgi:hypothetical protein
MESPGDIESGSPKEERIYVSSTPRPVIDIENLEEWYWPKIQWQYICSPAVNVIVSVYRLKQRQLFEKYDVDEDRDSLVDPNPFEPYYVFYVKRI